MNKLLDSFWRACAYCLHPRVMVLSLLPLVLLVALAMGMAYFFGQSAMDWTREKLDSVAGLPLVWQWLDGLGLGSIKRVLVPVLVVLVATPLLVMTCLLVVAAMMGPAVVRWVGARRFAHLESKLGASWVQSVLLAAGTTALALFVLFVSLPFWLIPPVALVVPPMVWGWLTYRVMAFDALSLHASASERSVILREHRSTLLAMGIFCGYLGALPTLVWASGAIFVVFFWFLIPVVVWMYTLVFAFSTLWFTHYCLSSLAQLRAKEAQYGPVVEPVPAASDSATPLAHLPPPM
jgi:hypothetical protein